MATAKAILAELKRSKDETCIAGMARFGITPKINYGISMPKLQSMAKRIGKNHKLALELWKTGVRDARLLASLIADPQAITPAQADSWAKGMDSWDVCDCACMFVFSYSPLAYRKARQWLRSKDEFVRRAGLATIASLTVHDKKAPDSKFEAFLPAIASASFDERNYVKKAANWALRQIGKRNLRLNKKALSVASKLAKSKSKSARWAGLDAVRELKSPKIQARLRK